MELQEDDYVAFREPKGNILKAARITEIDGAKVKIKKFGNSRTIKKENVIKKLSKGEISFLRFFKLIID